MRFAAINFESDSNIGSLSERLASSSRALVNRASKPTRASEKLVANCGRVGSSGRSTETAPTGGSYTVGGDIASRVSTIRKLSDSESTRLSCPLPPNLTTAPWPGISSDGPGDSWTVVTPASRYLSNSRNGSNPSMALISGVTARVLGALDSTKVVWATTRPGMMVEPA